MERSTLEILSDLVVMTEEDASVELARLHLIMNEDEWQELCDEYVTVLAEKEKSQLVVKICVQRWWV